MDATTTVLTTCKNDIAFIILPHIIVCKSCEEFIPVSYTHLKDEVKAEAGIATAVIRIDEERGSKKIFVNDGEISGEIDSCIK